MDTNLQNIFYRVILDGSRNPEVATRFFSGDFSRACLDSGTDAFDQGFSEAVTLVVELFKHEPASLVRPLSISARIARTMGRRQLGSLTRSFVRTDIIDNSGRLAKYRDGRSYEETEIRRYAIQIALSTGIEFDVESQFKEIGLIKFHKAAWLSLFRPTMPVKDNIKRYLSAIDDGSFDAADLNDQLLGMKRDFGLKLVEPTIKAMYERLQQEDESSAEKFKRATLILDSKLESLFAPRIVVVKASPYINWDKAPFIDTQPPQSAEGN